ncbi:MAG TPA: ATP synthase F1 subunit gamma [Sulfurovum sp.]|jgi:F-type H+-transporting ATPase subunit gamma|nr:MAG: F0F1 ATP synthase subunit gamma [Sulfurovum sp. 35-42-20]OYZ26065.1 MAG: F0F1 ATP synthase subunit gamma [Sulfurovum sp. 16-42-52]OYZ50456.1 MAG: F0F1 ATP synthase subunit gamma [Sulfurovum sp. 24-42-9]OZA46000.1 MAG: F0F1 ATP synthase subunit gamma [Sulfurovum sp. 17-42-90]OZA61442.1 MAG: F0F1 ATP synthase subunit gamma [Sulfurovum sp. 39-42-12]HQR74557.1 ATP synthase F1 subunit gamma [Sulfurovum sp.]
MANLKEIKRKIGSVKNTQKTTKAMKLVSSAKLKRTEELAKRSRVYAAKLTELLNEIAQKMHQNNVGGLDNIYFRDVVNPKVVDIVFITADKGLCGGFNAQTIKRVNQLIATYKAQDVKIRLRAVGRKGIDYYKFNNIDLNDQVIGLSAAPNFEQAAAFISDISAAYARGETDKIVLVHNGYVSMIAQEIREDQVLPIDASKLALNTVSTSELEVEPDDDDTLLEALVKRYVEYTMYYSLIDSLAAEHSARMQAMDAATTNAKQMVKELTVKYNKARQESITTELIEIISGVESMK